MAKALSFDKFKEVLKKIKANEDKIESKVDDLTLYSGYTVNDIYGVEVDFKNNKITRLGAFTTLNGDQSAITSALDKTKAWGGRKRVLVQDNGTVTDVGNDSQDGANGQVMVQQPKFYYKVVPLETELITDSDSSVKGYHLRKARYYVSDTPKNGFKLHPAFIRDGVEKDYIYLAAYEATLQNITESGVGSSYVTDDNWSETDYNSPKYKLASIAGAKPISGVASQVLTRKNTRNFAHKRGNGWEQSYAATMACTQLLFLIEYASFDSQRKIEQGITSIKDDGSTNMSLTTGATKDLGNKSGEVSGGTSGQKAISYRGEENFWGNIWTWVDGMNIQNPSNWTSSVGKETHGKLYVADHDFADNSTTSPYKDTGIYPVWANANYISAVGYSEEFDWLFIPTEVKGSTTDTVPDAFWNYNSGSRVAILGGSWAYGASAGAFCLNFGSALSFRYRDIGGRLVYVPGVTS